MCVSGNFHLAVNVLKSLSGRFVLILFQYVSEKIGGAKGTELENDIVDMEKVIHVFTNYNL